MTYVYDPMGNRTSMTSSLHGATTYSYDAGDRLLSFTDPGGTTTLTWDANGNMTGKGSATYTFDALDRLTQVVNGATTVQFAYNGDGVRLGKTVNGDGDRLPAGRGRAAAGGAERDHRRADQPLRLRQRPADAGRSSGYAVVLSRRWAGQHAGVEQHGGAADGCVQL